MDIQLLSNESIDIVVKTTQEFFARDTADLGQEGKKAYINAFLGRSYDSIRDLFPAPVADQIARNLNGCTLGEYLFSHAQFNDAFCMYLR